MTIPCAKLWNKFIFIPLVIIILIIHSTEVYAQDNGYHFRFDDWVNRGSRYLAIFGQNDGFRMSELPYDRCEMQEKLLSEKFSKFKGLGRFYYERLAQEVTFGFGASKSETNEGFELAAVNYGNWSDKFNPKDKVRYSIDLIGYSCLKDNLSIYFDFQFDTDGTFDSDYHGTREWKRVAGDMRAAYFKYSSNKWSVLIGRDYVHWGHGSTGSLLTSGYAPTLDMVKFTADIWKFRFQGFNAILGRTDEEQENKINRYFSGHRLSLRLSKFELAVHETIMNGGPGEFPNPGYMNPIMPYYFTDVMFAENRKDNVTLSMEASVYWPAHWRFYGQFLADEYYYEREPYPNQTAFLAGGDWTNALGSDRLWFNTEYVRISRWVYNYLNSASWNRLNYYNSILGHPMGADADLWHVCLESFWGKDLLIRTSFNYLRRGETTIDTPLIQKNEYKKNHPQFPFGVVEKKTSLLVECEYSPTVNWSISAALKYVHTKNVNHTIDFTENEMAYMLSLRYRYRGFWGK